MSIKISEKEGIVLSLLNRASDKKMYGVEISRASKGEIPLGTVYVVLGRLEKYEFVVSEKENEDLEKPRRFYKITKEGESAYYEWCEFRNSFNADWVIV